MSDTSQQRIDDDITEMRERYRLASEACADLYAQAAEDIRFVNKPGCQWDENVKRRRGENRPTYEFPKLRGHILQVINEIRQSRPQGKVRGLGEDDQGLAEIMQGLCRNVEATSNAETAYDIAAEQAVPGGLGFWRVCTDYLNDDDLEQDIRIKAIRNFASVKPDPAAVEIDRRDARFYFVEELMPRGEFKRKFGDDKLKNFDLDSGCQADWRDKDQVRIAEYWYKVPVTRELVGLSNGEVIDLADLGEDPEAALALLANPQPDPATGQAAQPVTVVQRRTVESHKVCMRLTNGHEFLTKEYEFPSKFIPIVPVWGNIYNIDGEEYWCGMVRYAKDQQRLHNYHRTAIIEAIAKAPKAPFIAKPKWIKGFEKYWQKANAEDYSLLLVDDAADQIPQRAQQAEVPVALIQAAGMDNDDIKAATGQFDASLGARSNETSGIAINNRKQQGATATFNYPDNLAKAMKFTYEIIGDMLPKVIDTPRAVRILGEDGGAKWKKLYQEVVDPETGERHVLNDISKGKYDYTVTVGPSFATQRMETAEMLANALSQIGGAAPQFAPLFAYGIVANMDGPGLEEFQAAARKVVVQMGLLPPKEGDPAPEPPQPNPKDVAAAERDHATTGKVQAETESIQLDNFAKAGQLHMMGAPPLPPIYPPDQLGPGMQPPQGGFFSPDGQPPGPQFTG